MPPSPPEGVFVKAGPVERLTREADLLRRAGHPGVVELVELRGQPAPALLTRLVDGPSLAEAPAAPVDDVAGLVAALATTVADLHRLGLVHGSIAPEHVIVAPGGRPVLCGLADGADADDPIDRARDVSALGELLRWLLARATRPHTAVRRRTAGAIAPLLSIALRATNPDPRLRPSASEMATDIRAAAPHATLPGQAVTREPEPRRWFRAPVRAAVAVLAVSVTLVGVMWVGGTPSLGPSRRPPAPRPAPRPTPVAPTCAAVGGALHADVDGDGCDERVRFAGGVLEAGPLRWAINGRTDDVATGDWDCDGRATLAFLDRGTGGVYRFEAWSNENVITVPLVAQVAGATGLRVTHRARPGCDVLTVERAGGPPMVLG